MSMLEVLTLAWLTPEILAFVMFGVVFAALLAGYPVALTLGGTAVLFALLASHLDLLPFSLMNAYPLRVFGVMRNEPLVALPIFIFMGVVLDRSGIATRLLETSGRLFGQLRGGLGISVVIVGALLAASTGIVGATVVTMGLIALPAMRRAGYDPRLSTGIICTSGTLGQIIPPSIVLILLGDAIQKANEEAASRSGVLVPEPVTIIDLFAGAILPGLIVVCLLILWQVLVAYAKPSAAPALPPLSEEEALSPLGVLGVLIPPVLLILAVLGSILTGLATATESAAVGAVGAVLLAAQAGKLKFSILSEAARQTVITTSMVFLILLGAQMFSLVFRALGGDEMVEHFLLQFPGGRVTAFIFVMLVLFALGFFLDFIEIILLVVPVVGPALIVMGFDPLWVGVMIALNLQTSFITPPFGFALFYLRGVAPEEIKTSDIYLGGVPFIALQLVALSIVGLFPVVVTWLPGVVNG